jgi:hypothetical protein
MYIVFVMIGSPLQQTRVDNYPTAHGTTSIQGLRKLVRIFSPLAASPSCPRRFASMAEPLPPPLLVLLAPAALLAPLRAFAPADHPHFSPPAPIEATTPPPFVVAASMFHPP